MEMVSFGDNAISLENVLAFATGVKEIPVTGFQQQPTLEFLHPAGKGTLKQTLFPKANTCACSM